MFEDYLLDSQDDSTVEILKYASNQSRFMPEQFDFTTNRAAYTATHNFGLPTFESGAQKILSKVFPSINGKNFGLSTLTRQTVHDTDKLELNVYARKKKIHVKDKSLLVKTCLFIRDKIIDLNQSISIQDSYTTLPQTSSAGFPNYGKKGLVSNTNFCIERLSDLFKMRNYIDIFNYLRKYPTTVFHRFSAKIKKNKNTFLPKYKIRQVLATPYFIVAIEKFIFFNFVKSFSESFSSYTVNLKQLQISQKIQKLRFLARDNNYLILCGDIQGNDKSISIEHSSLFFQIASKFINKSYLNHFNAIFMYYLRTPMLYSGGTIFSSGSTISGSWLTSCFTTLSVLIALQYSFHRIYGRFAYDEEYLIQGDDFVILLKDKQDSNKLKEHMLELNLRLRLDTSGLVYWYQNIEYLGYFWSPTGTPGQTDEWIIGKILYPKGFVRIDGPLRIIYRIIAIIVNLARFRELFTLFRKHDKELDLLFMRNENPIFTLISSDNTLLKVKIPFRDLWRYGWTTL